MGKKKIDINAKKGVDVNRVMEAAGLLKDSVVDEQAKKIKILEKSLKMNEELAERYHLESEMNEELAERYHLESEMNEELAERYHLALEKLQEDYKSLAAHFDGLCAERDNLAACLKSAENALAYKDKVIERIKKKNAKRMSEKCDVIAVLNKEIVFQYKRREKAEKFVNTLGQAFDLLKKNVEDYEHSIGR